MSKIKIIGLFLLSGLLLFQFGRVKPDTGKTISFELEKEKEEEKRGPSDREQYFYKMLRDPSTGQIPDHIRQKEIDASQNIPTVEQIKAKNAVLDFDITEVGPNNVGGRTRALALDITNSDVIIAGGVSGGIWKSVDGGQSWQLKSRPDQFPMVSSVAQDPRPGNTNTWYYSTGEFRGSGSADEAQARYNGYGIYKSTDNGETWNILPSTDKGQLNVFDSDYDFVSRIIVNPVNGSVFAATSFVGILRSTDGGASWSNVIGGLNDHAWSDVGVGTDGVLYATLSDDGGNPDTAPGVYRSTDNGDSWQNITPANLPAGVSRSVISVYPADSDLLYVYYQQADRSAGLAYINAADAAQNDIATPNIPDYGGAVGTMNLQDNYNIALIVKPNDIDNVVIGGTNLFRSTEGFVSAPPIETGWIGGYSPINNVTSYENHHPDIHALAYDPNNPNRLFSGHDGGIGVTEDITADNITWTSLNNGYNVTQFYTVSLQPEAGDNRIVGGAQDNGTPFFRVSEDLVSTPSIDVSSGDGSTAALRYSYGALSTQYGTVIMKFYDEFGDLEEGYISGVSTRVDPSACVDSEDPNLRERDFVHPYVIDYNDEDVMYFPCVDRLYRNTTLTDIPLYQGDAVTEGWELVPNFSLNGRSVSAIEVSQSNPVNRVYVAGFSFNDAPVMRRLDNAQVATNGGVDVSIPGLQAGYYIQDIAVNAEDADEVVAVVSNYNVESIFYSSDGGLNWTGIEGNLAGQSPLGEGPSVRSAAIAPLDGAGTKYFVGTSTGLYSTTAINGGNTQWVRESPNGVAFTIVQDLEFRNSDDVLAIATHGRGMFIGVPQGAVSNEEASTVPEAFALSQNYPNPFNPSTNIQFALPQYSEVSLSVFDVNGRLLATLINAESMSAGEHTVAFDASNLASGVYIYNLRAVSGRGVSINQSKMMTLIK